MKFSGRIYSYFIIILVCSTIITLAGIYGFQKLEPSINILNNCNTRSLYYAEQMIVSLAVKNDLKTFETYLNKAENNITENGEKDIVDEISASYIKAFKGNEIVKEKTIDKITALAEINRLAMEQAVNKAKKQQNIGIWIILFPSFFIWIIGITFLKRLDRTFIKPIQELNDTIYEYNNGNHMRRCPSVTSTKDLQMLYDGINNILDNK